MWSVTLSGSCQESGQQGLSEGLGVHMHHQDGRIKRLELRDKYLIYLKMIVPNYGQGSLEQCHHSPIVSLRKLVLSKSPANASHRIQGCTPHSS